MRHSQNSSSPSARSSSPSASMNLPVASHIDKLTELLIEMETDLESACKDLHILRGSIIELSYINKNSDEELNEFLVEAISGLRGSWGAEWDNEQAEMGEQRKKIQKMYQEHEDIEIQRQQIQDKISSLEEKVGLVG